MKRVPQPTDRSTTPPSVPVTFNRPASRSHSNARLAIGPLNIASQGSAWTRSARQHLGIGAFSFATNGNLSNRVRGTTLLAEKADYLVPHYKITPAAWRKHWLRRRLEGVTHVIAEGNTPLFHNPKVSRFVDEASFYSEMDVATAVVFHGSDARDPSLSLELDEHSYFRDVSPEWAARVGALAALNRESVRQAGVPVFVTTPDMLDHVPGARLLPISIEAGRWKTRRQAFSGRVPRVLHNPSSNLTKGTRFIMPVLEDLERRGRVELVLTDTVPRHRMLQLYEATDIVIDSIQIGAYGVTAVEAMAAGRLVVAHVSDRARHVLGDHIPVVEATPATFRDVMDNLIADVDAMNQIASAGIAYVHQWHDGRAASHAIGQFLAASEGNR